MSFSYRDRTIDSPLVKNVWHTVAEKDGTYLAAIDGCWDIIITKYQGKQIITANGQGTHAVNIPYKAGTEALGISFTAGATLQGLSGQDLLKQPRSLTPNTNSTIWLGQEPFEVPTFENIEQFIAQLLEKGILQENKVVGSLLQGSPLAMSLRSTQRHFLKTTGLTPYFFHQIQRAQQAVMLLQKGLPIAQVGLEVGYTDQAHMTKALKQLIGLTPTQIIKQSKNRA